MPPKSTTGRAFRHALPGYRTEFVFTVLMVISTALGPVTFGTLLDQTVGFKEILLSCAAAVTGAILQSFRIKRLSPFNF